MTASPPLAANYWAVNGRREEKAAARLPFGHAQGKPHSIGRLRYSCEPLVRCFASGEGFLDELPNLLVTERLHPLLDARRPVGAVLIHFGESRGNLRVATGETLHEFLPARGQNLRLGAGGVCSESRFDVAEQI